MVCSCQAGLQTVLGMLKSRASPSCVRRWGATSHIPRRQLRASLEAWPAEFETHRVTCGHCQPEVLTSESRGTGTAQQRNGSRIRPLQRSIRNDTTLGSPNGYQSCFLAGAMYLMMCFSQMTDLFYFPLEDTERQAGHRASMVRRKCMQSKIPLEFVMDLKNLLCMYCHLDSILCKLVSSILLSFSSATLRT